jgi:hypothetical protein
MTRLTRPSTARRSSYRITRGMSAIHRAHSTAPHFGCVLCIVGVVPGR